MSERQNKRRRARRDRAATVAGPAYLTRAIPPYEFMGEEDLVRIEEAAMIVHYNH